MAAMPSTSGERFAISQRAEGWICDELGLHVPPLHERGAGRQDPRHLGAREVSHVDHLEVAGHTHLIPHDVEGFAAQSRAGRRCCPSRSATGCRVALEVRGRCGRRCGRRRRRDRRCGWANRRRPLGRRGGPGCCSLFARAASAAPRRHQSACDCHRHKHAPECSTCRLRHAQETLNRRAGLTRHISASACPPAGSSFPER